MLVWGLQNSLIVRKRRSTNSRLIELEKQHEGGLQQKKPKKQNETKNTDKKKQKNTQPNEPKSKSIR
jgi:hypothetical protein